jgi:hypothetical protein
MQRIDGKDLTMPDNSILTAIPPEDVRTDTEAARARLQRWGALAFFLAPAAAIVSSLLYLTGTLQAPGGPLAYALADLLSGPVLAASLVTAVFALRERFGEEAAPRRMNLALLAACAAAAAFIAVACIRSANRHYHVMHPELHLEGSTTVLVVWTTLVAGVLAAGWNFLGWALLLIGSAGWASRLPRALSALYLAAGAAALFVFMLPDIEALAALAGTVVSIWQGILLWRAEPLAE